MTKLLASLSLTAAIANAALSSATTVDFEDLSASIYASGTDFSGRMPSTCDRRTAYDAHQEMLLELPPETLFLFGPRPPMSVLSRSVNLTVDLCCGLHERPVLPLPGGVGSYAHAAFFALRAHAARKSDSHNGLTAVIGADAALCGR